MTFEQLLYVEVLSHYHSLQEAADILHISKPGLSLAISQLENELGIEIFKRTKKGTFLTNKGLELLSSISKILKSKANLEELANYLNDTNNQQIIRIRYINTMLKSFITPFIKDYEKKYQHVFYDISCADTQTIINLVRNGEIDIGFIASSDIESEWIKDLIFKPVCHGKVVLYVSKSSNLLNNTITLNDLKEQKFCMFNDKYHDVLFDRLQYLCGPLNLILKTDDYWAIVETIAKLNAVCIGRLPQAILSRENIDNENITIDIGHLINDNTTLGWLINPSKKQSKLTQDLIDSITEDLQQCMTNN